MTIYKSKKTGDVVTAAFAKKHPDRVTAHRVRPKAAPKSDAKKVEPKAQPIAEPTHVSDLIIPQEEVVPAPVRVNDKSLFTKDGIEFVGSVDAEGNVTKHEVLGGVVATFPAGRIEDYTVTPLTKAEELARIG